MTTVLGIDPGLNRTGYAVLERAAGGPRLVEGGVIRATHGQTLSERVFEMAQGVREVIREFRPASLAIELVFAHRQYPKTSVLMAHARGAILYVARDHELPVMHYTPTQVKRLLTGSGKASKEQMQWAIQREFGLDRLLEPNDVADAAAVALCHYHHPRRTWPPHA